LVKGSKVMANLKETLFQIVDRFTFDYKNEWYHTTEVDDIWILNKKREALRELKSMVRLMDRDLRDLENKYYRELDKESRVKMGSEIKTEKIN
jgi:hypothetical protein